MCTAAAATAATTAAAAAATPVTARDSSGLRRIDLALCISGYVRTFVHAQVRQNHERYLLQPLLSAGATVDRFGALDVSRNDHRVGFSASPSTISAVLREAFVSAIIYNGSAPQLPANAERRQLRLPASLPGRPCLNEGAARGMRHLVPQFVKVRDAFGLALAHEKVRGRRYGHVAYMRPDVFFGEAARPTAAPISARMIETAWCKQRRTEGLADCRRQPRPGPCAPNDWFAVVPRTKAATYANLSYAVAGQCHDRRDWACSYCAWDEQLKRRADPMRPPVTECVLDMALLRLALPLKPGGGGAWPHRMMLARRLHGGALQCAVPVGYSGAWRREQGERTRREFPCEWMVEHGVAAAPENVKVKVSAM